MKKTAIKLLVFAIAMFAASCQKENLEPFRLSLPAGALPGVFTVNDFSGNKTQVHFSQGNLFYDGSLFKFEDNQYDVQSTWSTSHVSHFYFSASVEVAVKEEYEEKGLFPAPNIVLFPNAYQTTAKETFTVNVKGNEQKGWRALSTDEWFYLFNLREASKVGETENARYAKATVNGKSGIILLPDNYVHPSGIDALTNINAHNVAFTVNSFKLSDWAKIESAGAVFLPTAGMRLSSEISDGGCYWSSSSVKLMSLSTNPCHLHFDSRCVEPENQNFGRKYGCCVRLVTEKQ